MKPIAILQHEATQGPGILLDHLQQQGLPYRLMRPALGDGAPICARDYSGIVVLGSNHCANEDLDWMAQERRLLHHALSCDVPVLGHCFGAQMLARAMGARVRRNPCPSIGWTPVWVTHAAQQCLQLPAQATLFHWHYDTFEIPPGARRSMYGTYCLNQGFVHGPHWAFQGHLEVTEASVRAWCRDGHDELRHARGPAVQHESQILGLLPQHIGQLHALALRCYSAWTQHIQHPLQGDGPVHPAQWPPTPAPGCTKPPSAPHTALALDYQAPLAMQTKAILAQAVR